MPHNTMLFGYILILFQLEGAKSIESVMLAMAIVERVTAGWSDKGEEVKPKKPKSTN